MSIFGNSISFESSGSGGLSILSGTADPSDAVGQNGQLYLKYLDVPSGYTLLEYIQSTGTQYIDTGIIATSDISLEISFQDADLSGGDPIMLGYRPNTWSGGLAINNGGNTPSTNLMYLYYGGDGNGGIISEMAEGIVKLANGYREINGVRTTFTSVTFTYHHPMFVFAANNVADATSGGDTPFHYSKYKLRYLKIWNGETLVRDFVPVKDSNDVACLYDLVSDAFFYNAGTGDFTVGPAITTGQILASSAKVNGVWQNLVGANVNDITLSVGPAPDIPILTRAEWIALTTSQKQALGLIAIQDAVSGFDRGELVYGADYMPVELVQSGTGSTSASFTVSYAGEYTLFVLALNSEASTYALNLAVTVNGVAAAITEVAYNQYYSSGTNRRNYRLIRLDLNASAGDAVSISLTNSSNYTSLVWALTVAGYTTLSKVITTADATASGTNTVPGMVLYGIFHANGGGTVNLSVYEEGETVTTESPGSGYRSAYIFWFS